MIMFKLLLVKAPVYEVLLQAMSCSYAAFYLESGYICRAVKGNSDAVFTALPVRMLWRQTTERNKRFAL